ncbi:hypothetical protein TNCT_554101 [Trichonephila clavata]|uniref:Uncharacterized protein n=1 Tax=Trichonephila clavata TaxID=2740835 RepID=A0A8X6FJH6_TRICU|nr:hypothetical protein TNCT_554101 [Trichonephila clavata]
MAPSCREQVKRVLPTTVKEFQGYPVIGVPFSNYDGEVAAIQSAESQLENCNDPVKAVFLADSQAAIRNLSRNSE